MARLHDLLWHHGQRGRPRGPKKYLSTVGDDEFKQHPIGAGPYKFVSNKPGIEVELEAFSGYWRHIPHVKTLVMRSVPDATTRALMLKERRG